MMLYNIIKYQVLCKDKKLDTSLFDKTFDLLLLNDILKNENFLKNINKELESKVNLYNISHV